MIRLNYRVEINILNVLRTAHLNICKLGSRNVLAVRSCHMYSASGDESIHIDSRPIPNEYV